MYFGLGALLAGLAALMFLPLFWRRAVRLSSRSIEMQLPLSMTEIVAERDQLRAEFAIQRRMVEGRAEEAVAARARDLAELGRRVKHIASLEAEIVEVFKESEARADRLAALGEEIAAARAELGVLHQSHWDVAGRLENKSKELWELQGDHRAALNRIDEHRATIAALETRVVGLEQDGDEARRAIEKAKTEIGELTRKAFGLEQELAAARADFEAAAGRRDQALAQVRETRERVEAMANDHREERRARMRAETEVSSRALELELANAREAAMRESHARAVAALERQIADRDVETADLRWAHEQARQEILELARKAKAVDQGRAARAEADASAAPRDGDRLLLQRVEDLDAENQALRDELRTARRGPADAPGLDDAVEAATLRRALVDIGAKVTRMVEDMERREAADEGRWDERQRLAGAAE